jgi:hypothetical protein
MYEGRSASRNVLKHAVNSLTLGLPELLWVYLGKKNPFSQDAGYDSQTRSRIAGQLIGAILGRGAIGLVVGGPVGALVSILGGAVVTMIVRNGAEVLHEERSLKRRR